jgi:hypothetical protein
MFDVGDPAMTPREAGLAGSLTLDRRRRPVVSEIAVTNGERIREVFEYGYEGSPW